MQILIVEDDNDSRILLESVLESRDYDVISSTNGLEALRSLEHTTPDLIISDILMPIVDGFELCKRIKSNPKWQHIPIIIYSATYVETRDRQLALASGASKFLLKPIDPMQMLEEVAKTIAEHTQHPFSFKHVENDVDSLHIRVLQDKLQAKIEVITQKNHQLEEERELLDLTLDVSGMIAFRWHPESNLLIGSETLCRLVHGHTQTNQITLQELLEMTHHEDRALLKGAFERLKSNTGFVRTHFRLLTRTQGLTPMEMNAKQHHSSPPMVLGTLLKLNKGLDHLHQLNQEIEESRQIDQSTGLPNRNAFLTALQNAISQHQASQQGFCLLMFDLDHFKTVNQGLGHDYGETLMQEVADRLKQFLPSHFEPFRVGGDEFSIILNGLGDADAAQALAKKLLPCVAQSLELKGQLFNITASIGISQYPQDSDNPYGLLTAADNAVYEAKNKFGNCAVIYNADMTGLASERMLLSASLLNAIERNQLELHYQPKLDTATGKVTGVEALLRWRHPEWGMVMPDKFIPLAEQNGHIVAMGRWVFRQALTEPYIQQLAKEGGTISINLSIRQFADEQLIEFLSGLLIDTDFPAQALILEVTESTLQVAAQSIHIFKQIRNLGIKIAIDDFGTGYSSFGSLKQIKLDVLKIDKLFIKDINADETDYVIVQAMIKLAEALGMTTTAEGIEDADQLARIQSLGCHEYQGFYFSKPLPIHELETLIRKTQR